MMNSYLARRLLQFIPVLFGITVVTFFLVRLIPGDPCQMSLGPLVPVETIERCRVDQGLNLPIWQQYLRYLAGFFAGGAGAGRSLVYGQAALSVLLERLPTTLWLAGYAGLLTVLLALPIGIGAALRPGSLFDRLMLGASATVLTLPTFLIGILLVLLFSLKLDLFPTSGYGRGGLDHLRSLFLPALTLAMANGAMLARVLRRSLMNVMRSPYILTARAKGLSRRQVVLHHALRNGLTAPLTMMGLQLAWLLSGTVVVETMFGLPGLGSLMVQSVLHRDHAVVQVSALCFALIISGVTLGIDLIYPWLDPRVRYD